MAEEPVSWKSIKDFLLARTEGKPDTSRVPTGAISTAWMLLQRPPNEPYNEVYPGILLGDVSTANKPDKLKEIGVTHVINCCHGTKYAQLDTNQDFFQESGIAFHGIPAIDIMTFKMAPHFEKAVAFLEEAFKNEGNKVYVHCQSGVSRSASIVIAFLMCKRNMHVIDAVKKVREKRRILPNDGFLRELVELNKKLHGDSEVPT